MDYSPCPPPLQEVPDGLPLDPACDAFVADYQRFVRAQFTAWGWDYRTHWLFREYEDMTGGELDGTEGMMDPDDE